MQAGQPRSDVSSDTTRQSVLPIIATVIVATLTATIGGYVCGLAISRFGELGSASLWLLGAIAGYVSSKIMNAPSRAVGWGLAVACGLAMLVAETCWIHWKTVQGAEGWWISFALLYTFVQDYQVSALLAAIFTVFGAVSAYRQSTACIRAGTVD